MSKTMTPPTHIDRPEPISLETEPQEPNQYPTECLPSLIQEVVCELAVELQIPEAIAAQCVIGAINHMAMTRINVRHPKDYDKDSAGMPVTLFLLTVVESGDGKSVAQKRSDKAIKKHEISNIEKAKEQRQSLEKAKRKASGAELIEIEEALNNLDDGRRIFTDITFEALQGKFLRGKPAADWRTDEAGQLFGGPSLTSDKITNVLGGLTKLFDDGETSRDRVRGNLETSGIVFHRRLSFNLLAQEEAITKALNSPLLIAQGFLPRFLFASPDVFPGSRFHDVEKIIEAHRTGDHNYVHLPMFWELCQELIMQKEFIDKESGEVTPPILELTEEAIRVWAKYETDIEAQLGPTGELKDLRPFARRSGEIAIRLAANLAFVESKRKIDAISMESGVEIASYSLKEWQRYIEHVRQPQAIEDAKFVWEWLTEPHRMEKWSVFDLKQFGKSGPNYYRKASRRDKVLAVLLEHKLILPFNSKTFMLNPPNETSTED